MPLQRASSASVRGPRRGDPRQLAVVQHDIGRDRLPLRHAQAPGAERALRGARLLGLPRRARVRTTVAPCTRTSDPKATRSRASPTWTHGRPVGELDHGAANGPRSRAPAPPRPPPPASPGPAASRAATARPGARDSAARPPPRRCSGRRARRPVAAGARLRPGRSAGAPGCRRARPRRATAPRHRPGPPPGGWPGSGRRGRRAVPPPRPRSGGGGAAPADAP